MTNHKRYGHNDMHWWLITTTGKTEERVPPNRQAYACPYYVRLMGVLGPDWGVIVNPESERFGALIFEHEDCGCIGPCPRGNQRTDEWLDRSKP